MVALRLNVKLVGLNPQPVQLKNNELVIFFLTWISSLFWASNSLNQEKYFKPKLSVFQITFIRNLNQVKRLSYEGLKRKILTDYFDVKHDIVSN